MGNIFDFLGHAHHEALHNKEFMALVDKFQICKPIIHEDTMSAAVYEVLYANDQVYILKIPFNKERLKREIFCLTRLRDLLPVAEIVQIINSDNNFAGAILMTKIAGVPIKMTALTEALIFAMGEYLGKLHNISIDSYQDFAKPDQPIANPLLILEKYFQESMEECKIIVSSELLKQSEQNFKRFLPDLNDFDGPNIVHRDYRPGNVLMDDKDIVGIIDFENAMASFAQDDFSRMEMLVWPTYPTLKESFLQGYKQVRRLPNLEFLPLLKMCKLLGAIGFTIARGTWNNKYSHIYNNNLKLLVQLLAEF